MRLPPCRSIPDLFFARVTATPDAGGTSYADLVRDGNRRGPSQSRDVTWWKGTRVSAVNLSSSRP